MREIAKIQLKSNPACKCKLAVAEAVVPSVGVEAAANSTDPAARVYKCKPVATVVPFGEEVMEAGMDRPGRVEHAQLL